MGVQREGRGHKKKLSLCLSLSLSVCFSLSVSHLQDDRHVARVEQLDRVHLLRPAPVLGRHGEVHAEALEVDDDQEHDDGREQVCDVGQRRAVERLLQRLDLVAARQQQVEQRDDGPLELGAARSRDGVGREGLPDDVLADVGRDEQRDPGPEAVALLQQLVEADDDDARAEELEDDQTRVHGAEVAHVAVHAAADVGDRLADRDQHAEQFLGPVQEVAVGLDAVVDVDDLRAGEELHHEAGGDDGGDAELHAGAAVVVFFC